MGAGGFAGSNPATRTTNCFNSGDKLEGVKLVKRFGPTLMAPGKFEMLVVDCEVKRPNRVFVESMMASPQWVIMTTINAGPIQIPFEPIIDGKKISWKPWEKGLCSVLIFGT